MAASEKAMVSAHVIQFAVQFQRQVGVCVSLTWKKAVNDTIFDGKNYENCSIKFGAVKCFDDQVVSFCCGYGRVCTIFCYDTNKLMKSYVSFWRSFSSNYSEND